MLPLNGSHFLAIIIMYAGGGVRRKKRMTEVKEG